MTKKDLKALQTQVRQYEDFDRLLRSGEDAEGQAAFEAATGLKYHWLHSGRDYDNGEPSTWIVRFSLTAGIRIYTFQVEGWYTSYDGYEIDQPYNFYEVEPVEVTKIQWRRLDK